MSEGIYYPNRRKRELLVLRDVVSREVYELENKIMESRLAKIKYKYLEDKKSILIRYISVFDDEILNKDNTNDTENTNLNVEIPEFNMPII